jgi:hypothetical protein
MGGGRLVVGLCGIKYQQISMIVRSPIYLHNVFFSGGVQLFGEEEKSFFFKNKK